MSEIRHLVSLDISSIKISGELCGQLSLCQFVKITNLNQKIELCGQLSLCQFVKITNLNQKIELCGQLSLCQFVKIANLNQKIVSKLHHKGVKFATSKDNQTSFGFAARAK